MSKQLEYLAGSFDENYMKTGPGPEDGRARKLYQGLYTSFCPVAAPFETACIHIY